MNRLTITGQISDLAPHVAPTALILDADDDHRDTFQLLVIIGKCADGEPFSALHPGMDVLIVGSLDRTADGTLYLDSTHIFQAYPAVLKAAEANADIELGHDYNEPGRPVPEHELLLFNPRIRRGIKSGY